MTKIKRTIGVVMDPIERIKPAKDSTFAMMLEMQARGHEVVIMQQHDLSLENGRAVGHMRRVELRDNNDSWFAWDGAASERPLANLDAILMRKDPPFDMEFIYTTYILDIAERAGCLVVNRPAALRDLNEKASTALFPELTPVTLVTRDQDRIRAFLARHGHIVVKPLDGMGGRSVFTLKRGDQNTNVVIETLTDFGQQFAMAQVYLPAIADGDKRILLINGEPVDYMLARVPDAADGRGNLVMGATADARPLGKREREIAERVGPLLRERGVMFAGLDVIGDGLTEINVTSPTGIREIDRHFSINISALLIDAIEQALAGRD